MAEPSANTKLTGGKLRGFTFAEAFARDPDYAKWVFKNSGKSKTGNMKDFAVWLGPHLAKAPDALEERIYLNVSIHQRAEAKALGAKWDADRKMWYAPDKSCEKLLELFSPPRDLIFGGEDRNFGGSLAAELIPASCSDRSLECCVSAADWEDLRRSVFARAGCRCEACGNPAFVRCGLRVHDRWAYDAATSTRKLVRLVCLCAACLEATRVLQPRKSTSYSEARDKLRAVSKMSEDDLDRHFGEVFAAWVQRSKISWKSDMSLIAGAGLTLIPQ